MNQLKKFFFCFISVILLFVLVPAIIPIFPTSYTVQAADLNTYYKKMTKGQTYTLYMKKTSKKASWYSSNKSVATVNSKGKITAKKAGTTFITAKIGKARYTCKVVVVNPPIKMSASNIAIIKGNTYTLKMNNTKKSVKWYSSNKKIATVNSKGKVTAVSKGTTYIKAQVGGKTYSCKVTVQAPYFSYSSVSIYVGDVRTYALKGTTKKITYKSSNSSIVRVASNGKITGINSGTATITATVDRRSYSYKTVVNKRPSLTVVNGWRTINGKKYYYINNVPVKGYKDINGRRYYFDSSGALASQFGIDVSKFQGTIDWNKAKADGVEFAIIRAGYGMDMPEQDDPQFLRNIAECERLGIPYGVYLYSYANTIEKASSEAEHVLRLINGFSPKLGIWYDVEDKIHSNLSQDMLTQIIDTFSNKIRQCGYSVGIYANADWLQNKIAPSVSDSYPIWLAHWTTSTTYKKPFVMWQYSGSGRINGISSNVDFNIRILK